MSKIGEKPVTLSSAVSLKIEDNNVTIKGPQGEMSFVVPRELTLIREKNNLIFKRKNNEKAKSLRSEVSSIRIKRRVKIRAFDKRNDR